MTSAVSSLAGSSGATGNAADIHIAASSNKSSQLQAARGGIGHRMNLTFLLPFISALTDPGAFLLPSLSDHGASDSLISPDTEAYINNLLTKRNSSGLSIAVIQKKSPTSPWVHEFGSYGVARADGSPITPDTVFAIASNSKLFVALTVGLLISNKTLARERGQEITWTTKARDLIPEWKLMDTDMSENTTLQDMLSHRTGLPRHDYSRVSNEGGLIERIARMRHLKPSASFREAFQYNNLMFIALSYLPQALLNQPFHEYVAQHIFNPLNMTSTTYSIKEAQDRGTFADGFLWTMRDWKGGINGTRVPIIPYYQTEGEEYVDAGPGGVLSSARDLVSWALMLLNNGGNPHKNETIIPQSIIDHVSLGLTVGEGKASYPELSPKVYGAAQFRYSYQGHEIVEHGGDNPGFKSQISRFPNDNLAIISLSNDEHGGKIMEAAKWRIAEDLLRLKKISWIDRYEREHQELVNRMINATPRPEHPKLPSIPLSRLAEKMFTHPTYGTLQPCAVPPTFSLTNSHSGHSPHDRCVDVLASHPVRRILSATNLSIPTFIIPWKRTYATHLRLSHFSGDIFNMSLIWTNAEVRAEQGYSKPGVEDKGDVVSGLDQNYEVEWVHGEEEGLAFKGNFWGKEGPQSWEPMGKGKEGAEVWFDSVDNNCESKIESKYPFYVQKILSSMW